MKKRWLAAALVVAVLLAGVAVGVHVMNKEARAVVPRTVKVVFDDEPQAGVHIKIVCDGLSIDDETDAEGMLTLPNTDETQSWSIIDLDGDFNFIEGTPIVVDWEDTFRRVDLE